MQKHDKEENVRVQQTVISFDRFSTKISQHNTVETEDNDPL